MSRAAWWGLDTVLMTNTHNRDTLSTNYVHFRIRKQEAAAGTTATKKSPSRRQEQRGGGNGCCSTITDRARQVTIKQNFHSLRHPGHMDLQECYDSQDVQVTFFSNASRCANRSEQTGVDTNAFKGGSELCDDSDGSGSNEVVDCTWAAHESYANDLQPSGQELDEPAIDAVADGKCSIDSRGTCQSDEHMRKGTIVDDDHVERGIGNDELRLVSNAESYGKATAGTDIRVDNDEGATSLSDVSLFPLY